MGYCSAACRDAANAGFHRHECRVNGTLAGFGCSQVARLALRMVTSRPLQYFLDRRGSLDAASKTLDETSDMADSDNAYVQGAYSVDCTPKINHEICFIQGRAKLMELSLVTHVPSVPIGCAWAGHFAWQK